MTLGGTWNFSYVLSGVPVERLALCQATAYLAQNNIISSAKRHRILLLSDIVSETAMNEQPVARRRAVFFDRDGVINEDLGYVSQPEQFRFMPGAPDAIRWLNKHGWLAIVVTNQSGIGRGWYTEEDFLRLTRWIDQRLAELGAHLDATYYCPHHPTEAQGPYRIECQCRKPAPGMILRAIAEWNIDPARSLLIGNKQHDLLAAVAAGVRGLLFQGGNLLEFVVRACEEAAANDSALQV